MPQPTITVPIDRERVAVRAFLRWVDQGEPRPGDPAADWFWAENRGTVEYLGGLLGPQAVAILVVPFDDDGLPIVEQIEGASGVLVDTGKAHLLFTAEHVIAYFAQQLRDNPQRQTRLLLLGTDGSTPVDISSWPVRDRHRAIDFAVIAVPQSFDPVAIGRRFYGGIGWSHRRARRDETAVVVGFPGIHRRIEMRQLPGRTVISVRSGLATVFDFVSSVSDRHFVMADESGFRQQIEAPFPLQAFGPQGGMSGGPAFVREGDQFVLMGCRYEGSRIAMDDEEGHRATAYIAHCDFVQEDGTLDHGRIVF